jgi:hypothetical protein
MEQPMLEYKIVKPEGILILNPHGALTKTDFASLAASVDAYLADYPIIHGVLIHSESFPGWDSFVGFSSHLRFVRDHHQKVKRVALVTNSSVAGMAESLSKHFIAADIELFPFADFDDALNWLKTSSRRDLAVSSQSLTPP